MQFGYNPAKARRGLPLSRLDLRGKQPTLLKHVIDATALMGGVTAPRKRTLA